MTSREYGISITVSLMIHFIALVIIAGWGTARGRYDNDRSAISVRLETEPVSENKNSDALVRKAEVKHLTPVSKMKDTNPVKEEAVSEVPVVEVEQFVVPEGKELNELAKMTLTVQETASYGTYDKDLMLGDTLTAEGSGGEGPWRPVLLGRIKAAIQDAVSYPTLARKQGLEGTVVAGFSIDDIGLPREIRVIKSSGHGILDREVRRIIKRASPYPPLDGTIEVPVVFRLGD